MTGRGITIVVLLAASAVLAPARADAQAPPAGGDASPMSCWWRTDKGTVRVGEPFQLTLTCRVRESERAAVVPNLGEIEPASIQLTPFDVLEGVRHEDLVTPGWRHLQFTYTVRLLGEEFFGRDVAIPATALTFRIRTAGADAVEGRERTYVLPAMPIRILSLVPAQASDIRDPSSETFGLMEARRFRATAAMVAAVVSFGLATVLLLAAGVRALHRTRTRGAAARPALPVGAVLGGCVREVERVRAEAARDAWTPALAAHALASFRIASAIALSQPVAHAPVAGNRPAREGQLAVRHGMLRRRRSVVSASMTTDAIERLRGAGNGTRPPAVAPEVLDGLRDALAGLNAVRYGRNGRLDTEELDRILDSGSRALRRLRTANRWPSRAAAALARSAARLGPGAWRP